MASVRFDKRRKRFILDFNNGVKRCWVTMPKNATRSWAKRRLREILSEIDKGSYRAPKDVPKLGIIVEDWLEGKKQTLRRGSLDQCRGHCQNHILPFLEDLRVTEINYGVAEKFKHHCLQKNISNATVNKILTTLGAVLTYAVRCGHVDKNVVRELERPKRTLGEHKQINPFSPEEIQALLAAIPQQKYRVFFLTAVLSGLRSSELLALRWKDILFDSGQISVERSYSRGEFNPPKSRAGIRKVDVPKALLLELRKWRIASGRTGENDLVWSTASGRPLSRGNLLRRHYRPALKRANVPYRHFHTLRHTFCSLLIAQGEDIHYVKTMLGHSTIMQTIDTYGHLMKDARPAAAEQLGATVLGG